MKMVKICAVKSCSNGYKTKKEKGEALGSVSFFQASTLTRLQDWTKSLGMNLKFSDYICQYHFQEKDIKMYDKIVIGNTIHLHYRLKKTLQPNALPTIEHQFKLIPEFQQEEITIKEENIKEEPIQEQQPEQVQQLEYNDQQQQNQFEQFQEQKYNIPDNHYEQQTFEVKQTIECMRQNIPVLPPNWLYTIKPNEIEFMRFDPASKQIKNHIVLNEDLSVSVIFLTNERLNLDNKLTSSEEILNFLKYVERWPLCVGTQMDKSRYSNGCKGVIIGDETYKRNQMNPRCKSCRVLRYRLQKCKSSTLDKTSELKRRNENMTKQCKRLKKLNLKLKEEIFELKVQCARMSKNYQKKFEPLL
ncbi:uncharacterized protein LOC130440961 isoform X1 [Diorhabda sublineata]|uniref:uncharacterized protein LOC130440961 isoform X1 n=1 Tax=Diorhabda sublineata TaxID=1163346 RepID=UPI0024E069B5|nr:uncharacterized protein LOC130440961 isoform X1 [Diorhabda sublineata]XP_056630353.1 uncharacterized protein LOC130440961 isoform X1 [Diorhabda sublineata]XP_056630354.1 uncharacterized protein LOC130440961 isoform X1 [Diorhabda sublineata]